MLCVVLFSGKATGDLYEDDGDGFGYRDGDYLHTHYEAEKVSSPGAKDEEVVIRIVAVEGRRERPKRTLQVRLLIGENVQVLEKAASGFFKMDCSCKFLTRSVVVSWHLGNKFLIGAGGG